MLQISDQRIAINGGSAHDLGTLTTNPLQKTELVTYLSNQTMAQLISLVHRGIICYRFSALSTGRLDTQGMDTNTHKQKRRFAVATPNEMGIQKLNRHVVYTKDVFDWIQTSGKLLTLDTVCQVMSQLSDKTFAVLFHEQDSVHRKKFKLHLREKAFFWGVLVPVATQNGYQFLRINIDTGMLELNTCLQIDEHSQETISAEFTFLFEIT